MTLNQVEVQRRLLDILDALTQACSEAEDNPTGARLLALAETIVDRKLRVAVVGEFGNGKTTLVNSLLGSALLPAGLTPATRAISVLSWGAQAGATLVYEDGQQIEVNPSELPALSDEQIVRLQRIEFRSNSPLLERMIFMDLPGLGDPESTSPEDVDEIVGRADAAICVLNCDRLLSLTEQTYLRERLSQAGIGELCFVLNRCDGKTPEQLESLVTRARNLLGDLATSATLFPYSAQGALPTRSRKKEPATPDPEGFREYIRTEWPRRADTIRLRSSTRKLEGIAAALEAKLSEREQLATAEWELVEGRSKRVEARCRELQDRVDETVSRAASHLRGIQEQFLVGLKEFALRLREEIPREVMAVPVDEARRFLPFYIQESLERAVEANHDSIHNAVAHMLESFSEDVGSRVRSLMADFQVDVEPPAIPLYVPRDKAPLSQSFFFLSIAASVLALQQAPVGALVFCSGLLSRELGQHLEAADRRAALSSSAQALVHGSIESMEYSLKQQFDELEQQVVTSIRDCFAPAMEEAQAAEQAAQRDQEEVLRKRDAAVSAGAAGRTYVQQARASLRELPTVPLEAPTPAPVDAGAEA